MSPVAADCASAWSAPGLCVVPAVAVVVVVPGVEAAVCFELPQPAARPASTRQIRTANVLVITPTVSAREAEKGLNAGRQTSRRASSTAASASDAATYAHRTPKPVQGASWFPRLSASSASPAWSGRYGEAAEFQLAGRTFISGGSTNMIPAKVAIPPAVLRTIAPSPSPNKPITVRYSAAPNTARGTPAWVKAMLMCRPERIACETTNASSTAGVISASVTSAYTTALPQSTGRRRGTAVIDARIIPVEYSAVITSTPSTPMASWEIWTPTKVSSSGWKSARS